jgi:hypothetical protein
MNIRDKIEHLPTVCNDSIKQEIEEKGTFIIEYDESDGICKDPQSSDELSYCEAVKFIKDLMIKNDEDSFRWEEHCKHCKDENHKYNSREDTYTNIRLFAQYQEFTKEDFPTIREEMLKVVEERKRLIEENKKKEITLMSRKSWEEQIKKEGFMIVPKTYE